MTTSKFKGTGVALVTPFNAKGQIDYASLEKLINFCIEGGVEYLGFARHHRRERKFEQRREARYFKFYDRKKCRTLTYRSGIWRQQHPSSHPRHGAIPLQGRGCHFVGKSLLQQAYARRHFSALQSSGCKLRQSRVILYNVPGRTSSNMLAATTLRIAHEVENVIGMKEASGDFGQCMQLAKNKPKDFLYSSRVTTISRWD
jgi:4-hydroxy-tetrahydrodipicolinate synthase